MAEKKGDGKIPTLHIVAKSIPEAYYEAIKAVHEKGYKLRTEYDRKVDSEFIDPPGKDAKVMIEIKNPFAEPRFPPLSYCERGKYIAEFLGAKDHLVVPYLELKEMLKGREKFEPTQWPYCYHQRLTAYPEADDSTINQLESMLNDLSKSPLSRRINATTIVPVIDRRLKSDQPCLREIEARAIENNKGQLVFNMHAHWRSRDLYKAWGDNLIGITNLQRELTTGLSEKTGREVIIGPYSESNFSLHIYGQDYKEKGMNRFFKNFPDKESFIKRSLDSKTALKVEIIPQLMDLKEEETWRFPPESIALIDRLIYDFSSGKYLP